MGLMYIESLALKQTVVVNQVDVTWDEIAQKFGSSDTLELKKYEFLLDPQQVLDCFGLGSWDGTPWTNDFPSMVILGNIVGTFLFWVYYIGSVPMFFPNGGWTCIFQL